MLLLIETKLSARRIRRVRESCGFSSGIEVDTDGSRGGLSVRWVGDYSVQSHNDVEIDEGGDLRGFMGRQMKEEGQFLESSETVEE